MVAETRRLMTPPLPTNGHSIGEISGYGCVTVTRMTASGPPVPGVPSVTS